jgi:hypothetical protein
MDLWSVLIPKLNAPQYFSLFWTMIFGAYWVAHWKHTKKTVDDRQPWHSILLHTLTAITLNTPYHKIPWFPILNYALFERTALSDAISMICSAGGVVFMIWARYTLADKLV